MSVRKYNIEKMTPEELADLEAKFPRAVQTVTIRKPVYNVIAKLLDCGVDVPGVRLVDHAGDDNDMIDDVVALQNKSAAVGSLAGTHADDREAPPEFLKKGAA